jgi:hypothetical protein
VPCDLIAFVSIRDMLLGDADYEKEAREAETRVVEAVQ